MKKVAYEKYCRCCQGNLDQLKRVSKLQTIYQKRVMGDERIAGIHINDTAELQHEQQTVDNLLVGCNKPVDFEA